MLSTKSLFLATFLVLSIALFGQPSLDIILLTAPTITETMEEADVISTYSAPATGSDDVWVLPPTGTKVLTKAGKLAGVVDIMGQTGTYSFYFPLSGLRADLIVE